MRHLLITFFAVMGCAASLWAEPFSHTALDEILQANVDSSGLVNYAALKAQPAALAAYVDSLGATSPHSDSTRFPTRDHELAYWINAYNAFVLWGVVEAYPVDSVKEIGLLNGFFNRHKFRAGGKQMTLNHIENDIIRPVYRDARIHFAVNCGAISCPSLASRAYHGERLDAQLQQAMQHFANDSKHVDLDEKGRLHLSKILEWYGDDFIKWFPADRLPAEGKPTIVDYLLPWLPQDIAEHVREGRVTPIEYNDYDWALNRQPK